MRTEVLNKNGSISAYGYACGYVNRVEKGNRYKELYKEHNTFHVRWNLDNGDGRHWESFDTLAQAQKKFVSVSI